MTSDEGLVQVGGALTAYGITAGNTRVSKSAYKEALDAATKIVADAVRAYGDARELEGAEWAAEMVEHSPDCLTRTMAARIRFKDYSDSECPRCRADAAIEERFRGGER